MLLVWRHSPVSIRTQKRYYYFISLGIRNVGDHDFGHVFRYLTFFYSLLSVNISFLTSLRKLCELANVGIPRYGQQNIYIGNDQIFWSNEQKIKLMSIITLDFTYVTVTL